MRSYWMTYVTVSWLLMLLRGACLYSRPPMVLYKAITMRQPLGISLRVLGRPGMESSR